MLTGVQVIRSVEASTVTDALVAQEMVKLNPLLVTPRPEAEPEICGCG